MFAIYFGLFVAGVISGLIQFFVDFKKLPVYGVSSNDGAATATKDQDWFTLLIMFFRRHWQIPAYIVIGIAGALLVPVIHQLTNNGLPGLSPVLEFTKCLKDCVTEKCMCSLDNWNLLILIGYGIIFGVSSVRIMRSLADFFLANITAKQQQQQEKIHKASLEIENLKEKLKEHTAHVEDTTGRIHQVFCSSTRMSNPAISSVEQKTYFDAADNEINKSAYYKDIDFSNGKALYNSLSKLVIETHAVKIPYKPALHLYPAVDLHEDGLLRSVYSGKTFTLSQLIAMDAEADRQREQLMSERNAALLTEAEANTLAGEAEQRFPYNCEHVVPQSWFNKLEPMRGDLHHLFTCNVTCNSFRSNHRYFDFADYEVSVADTVKGECGKQDKGRFEPERNKGVAARAVLYFLLRYPMAVSASHQFKPEEIQSLIAWHKKQPPSQYEFHRNAEIFKLQGNRNPFIDFPDSCDHVQFP